MRTVHETEALRPSDPVPKHHSSNPQNKQQRLRITMGKGGKENGEIIPKEMTPPSPVSGGFDEDPNEILYSKDPHTGRWVPSFPSDLKFSAEELALPPKELLGLLQYQIDWATEKSEELKREEAVWNEKREAEAVLKNLLLKDYQIHSEKQMGNGHVMDDDIQMTSENQANMDQTGSYPGSPEGSRQPYGAGSVDMEVEANGG
jgi:hypothetical protein